MITLDKCGYGDFFDTLQRTSQSKGHDVSYTEEIALAIEKEINAINIIEQAKINGMTFLLTEGVHSLCDKLIDAAWLMKSIIFAWIPFRHYHLSDIVKIQYRYDGVHQMDSLEVDAQEEEMFDSVYYCLEFFNKPRIAYHSVIRSIPYKNPPMRLGNLDKSLEFYMVRQKLNTWKLMLSFEYEKYEKGGVK